MSIMSTLRAYADSADSHYHHGDAPLQAELRRWALTMREAADMIDSDTATIDKLRQALEANQ